MAQQRAIRSTPLVALSMGLFALTFVALLGCERIQHKKEVGGPAASYEQLGMYLFGESSLSNFSTAGTIGIAKVYVEFPDGSRHFLPQVSEEAVGRNLEKLELISGENGKTEYGDGLSHVVIKDGRLQRFKLEAGLATWKIAAKKEGPYLALPISKADLVKHFGEPDSWDVYVPPRVP